ncbi:hypothetical protein DFH07DRAFT_848175 [Mycena maculata]|uniref:MYND-type domain-containing protein n=1 Tax=Mycena maculata TaxID=230809 RepID=A0AAD7HY27_9AGAR|nr:hypothetical protein DFH07DRAFT_848175 [Mycena maculata]
MPTASFKRYCQRMFESAAKILDPFLSSPDNSPICAATIFSTHTQLIMFMSEPNAGPQQPNVRPDLLDAHIQCIHHILRTNHHAFLNALMHLVAIPRSDAQLQRMQSRLDTCRCDLSDPSLRQMHGEIGFTRTARYKEAVWAIFAVLLAVVHMVGHVPGAQLAVSRKWPTNTGDLLPAGAEDAVVSFTALYRLSKAATILHLVRVLLPHCPSLVRPLATSSPFWQASVDGLQSVVDQLHTNAGVSEIDLNEVATNTPLDSFRAFLLLFQDLTTMLVSISQQNVVPAGLMPQARRIHDLFMTASLILASSPGHDLEVHSTASLAASMARSCRNMLPMDQRPQIVDGPQPPRYAQMPEGEGPQAFFGLFGFLSLLTSSTHCCSIGCPQTSETSLLRKCTVCQVMRYCSTICQRDAWPTHKTVCKDLRKLNAIAALLYSSSTDPNKPQSFEIAARKQGFTDDRMKEIVAGVLPFFRT